MKYLLILFLLAGMGPARAADGPAAWTVIPEDSSVTFAVDIDGVPSEGEFEEFTGDILFDPARLDQSRVAVVFDLTHISAAYSDVADKLKEAAWFDVASYPAARFVSRSFKHLGGKEYEVAGDLTLRDHTQPETLYFTLTVYSPERAVITGRMQIKRLDYGIGQGAWRDTSVVANEVRLSLEIRALRQ